MTKKWNLQDIRPAEPKKPRPSRPTEIAPEDRAPREQLAEKEDIPSIEIGYETKGDKKRLIISIILFVVIVAGGIGLSALMGKTELTVHPFYREPNVSSVFTAYPDKREDSLSYEILTLEATEEAEVKATGQMQVDEQATGMIEIIKTTPGSERLIKNTRFRSPEGLVFRIQESVVVPGAEDDTTPGSIQTEVFADEAGEEYNLEAGTEFDIPGFEEGGFTELYNSISAVSPTSFTGGYSGPQFQIDENELTTARQGLQTKLREDLLAKIDSEKAADFIAFPGAVAITYNELPAVRQGEDLVTIKEQATLQIPLFNNTEFGSFLAQETIATYDDNPVRVDDPSQLTFQYTSATTSSNSIANEPSLEFRLTGKPLLIWQYDAEGLTRDLVGLPKTAITNAVGAYPGIQEASVNITPVWKRNFPESPEDIVIVEELKELE